MPDPFHDHPLYGHPWQGKAQREAKGRARHALWLASFSDADWMRIEELATQITAEFCPARLDDLDAPGIAVGVCRVGEERWVSGERIGTLRDGTIAVLVWVK